MMESTTEMSTSSKLSKRRQRNAYTNFTGLYQALLALVVFSVSVAALTTALNLLMPSASVDFANMERILTGYGVH